MAGSDLMTNAGVASIAYNDALMQARNAQNSLLRSYGFVGADAGGNYTTASLQKAFDPRTLFKDAAPSEGDITSMSRSMKVGGTGQLADILRAGGTTAAETTEAAQHAGFGADTGVSGGIVQQRMDLARKQAQEQLQGGELQFLQGEAQALGGIGQAQSDLQQARLYDIAQGNLNRSLMGSILNPRGVTPKGRGKR